MSRQGSPAPTSPWAPGTMHDQVGLFHQTHGSSFSPPFPHACLLGLSSLP